MVFHPCIPSKVVPSISNYYSYFTSVKIFQGYSFDLYYYSPGFAVANVVSKKYAVPLVTRRGVPGHH